MFLIITAMEKMIVKKDDSEIVDVNHSYIVDEYEDLIDNTF